MTAPSGMAGVPCLVLGAGGFIGTNLCRALLSAGADLRGFGRRPAFPEAVPSIPWTVADFGDAAALRDTLTGAEIVFHLLGPSIPARVEENPAADLRTNAATSVELPALCRDAGVRRVVFVSSGGTVYGVPRRLPIPEDHPTDPTSAYGIHKLLLERHLALGARRGGPDAIILRVANPYGPFQVPDRGQGLVATVLARRLAGRPVEIWGDGRAVRDYLHVDDLTDAMLRAARYDGEARILNIGSGTGRSALDVVAAVDRALGVRDAPVLHRPARNADVPSNVLDASLAARELGWSARTAWPEGLSATADWLRRNVAPAAEPAPCAPASTDRP